uniref:Uncharacterized protein n=1 Tax=Bionectria ochroleuca TaxID=29856 RepID=A0A8H7N579_BIOOC
MTLYIQRGRAIVDDRLCNRDVWFDKRTLNHCLVVGQVLYFPCPVTPSLQLPTGWMQSTLHLMQITGVRLVIDRNWLLPLGTTKTRSLAQASIQGPKLDLQPRNCPSPALLTILYWDREFQLPDIQVPLPL